MIGRTRGFWVARNGGRVPTETYWVDVGDQIHLKTKARICCYRHNGSDFGSLAFTARGFVDSLEVLSGVKTNLSITIKPIKPLPSYRQIKVFTWMRSARGRRLPRAV